MGGKGRSLEVDTLDGRLIKEGGLLRILGKDRIVSQKCFLFHCIGSVMAEL